MSSKRYPKYRKKGYFVQLYEEMLRSQAYRDLCPTAKCLLVELLRVYRPSRNGRVSISVRNASKLIGCHKDTACKAYHELLSHGFIALGTDYNIHAGKAREYRLTFLECNGRSPTDDWQLWSPENPLFCFTKKRNKPTAEKKGLEVIH